MKLKSTKFNGDSLTINFDTSFKQIDYVKMECINNQVYLESEQLQIKFSKIRNWIDVSLNKQNTFTILLVKQINSIDCLFSYYISYNNDINKLNTDTNKENMDTNKENIDINEENIIFLKLKSNDDYSNCSSNSNCYDNTNTNIYIYCPIKNENIFAKFKKKV